MEGNWTIKAAVICDKGLLRKNNEDAFFFDGYYAPVSEMDDTMCLLKERKAPDSLWAICDGMGGQSNGEIASYTAVSKMPELLRHLQENDFETAVQEWVNQVNGEIETITSGGTTFAALYSSGKCLQSAYVGDSRIYRFSQGKLIRLTRDHTKVEMMVSMGLITEEEAKTHPQRHTLSRYLGMDTEYICNATVSEKIPYCSGDRYLLCSDGVTDMLTDNQLEAILSVTENCETCAVRIRDAVFDAGAMDNTTLMVLDIIPSCV